MSFRRRGRTMLNGEDQQAYRWLGGSREVPMATRADLKAATRGRKPTVPGRELRETTQPVHDGMPVRHSDRRVFTPATTVGRL